MTETYNCYIPIFAWVNNDKYNYWLDYLYPTLIVKNHYSPTIIGGTVNKFSMILYINCRHIWYLKKKVIKNSNDSNNILKYNTIYS